MYEWHADELTDVLDDLGFDICDLVGILPARTHQEMTTALTERFGHGAAEWYTRMQTAVAPEFLGPVAAAALPEVATELLYVCAPKDR